MTYYIGTSLENRVKQYGLQELYALLTEVGGGQTNWPGTCIIQADPQHLEPIRVTIYSILHEMGLKPQFRVKMVHGGLTLEQRYQKITQVNFTQAGPRQEPIRPGDTLQENLESVFDDTPFD